MTDRKDGKDLPEDLLECLSDWLTANVGLHFAKRRQKELRQRMADAMKDFDFDDVEAFIAWLVSLTPTKRQIEILAAHLTIGETYFFRERRAFEILEQILLPPLIAARRKTERRLRIWSAGCSTGEEPYSIAILLDRMIPDLHDWNVSILATDINTDALGKAREGSYSDWSFRDTPPLFREKYFEKVNGGRHLLAPRIREMVAFSYLNLSEDQYPSLRSNTNAMDVIFCRNVLMYFAPAQIGQAAERFHRSLLDGGHLIVSPVETSLLLHSPCTAVRFGDTTLFRRDARGTRQEAKVAQPVKMEAFSGPPTPETAKRCRLKEPSRPLKHAVLKKPQERQRTLGEEAALLYRNGSYGEAEERLGRLMAGGGQDREAVVLYAKVLANQGRLDEALHWCEKAVAADKCNPLLHYLLATILVEQKRPEEARASLKKALYLDGNFVLAHFALANLFLSSGKAAPARKHFSNVIEILSGWKPADVIPESEGMTAGGLVRIVAAGMGEGS